MRVSKEIAVAIAQRVGAKQYLQENVQAALGSVNRAAHLAADGKEAAALMELAAIRQSLEAIDALVSDNQQEENLRDLSN